MPWSQHYPYDDRPVRDEIDRLVTDIAQSLDVPEELVRPRPADDDPLWEHVPDSGLVAHGRGYPMEACPYEVTDPAGAKWRANWITADSLARRREGTFGATDDEYQAAGLHPPDHAQRAGPNLGPFTRMLQDYIDALTAAYSQMREEAAKALERWNDAMRQIAAVTAVHGGITPQEAQRIINQVMHAPNRYQHLHFQFTPPPSGILGSSPAVTIIDDPFKDIPDAWPDPRIPWGGPPDNRAGRRAAARNRWGSASHLPCPRHGPTTTTGGVCRVCQRT